MKHQRSDAGCTVVGDFICVAGGTDGRIQHSSVEVYNTSTGKWLRGIPNMSMRRTGLSCASLNDELYVFGGYPLKGSCEKYNFTTKKWTNLGSMNNHRYGLASIIFDSKIFAIGGDFGTCSSAEVYDATNNTWTKCEGMPVRRYGIAGVVVSGKDLGKEVLKSYQHPFRNQED